MLTALLALQCAAQACAPPAAGSADDVPRDRRAEYAAAIARGHERHRAFASEQAIDAYHEALLLDPAGFEALRGLADAWNDVGEATTGDAAEDAFVRALGHAQCLEELFPTMPDGPYWKAVAYGNLTTRRGPGDKVALAREIAAAARCALDKDPEFAPAFVALGIYERELAGLGFFARMAARALFGFVADTSLGESERLLRRAVSLAPQSLLARYELGLTLLAANEKDAATAELRVSLELVPSEASDIRRQLDAAALLARDRR
jgi:tetratricopeptide (TPR) repeat protein